MPADTEKNPAPSDKAPSPGVSLLLDTIKSLEKRTSCLLEVARFVRELHDFRELLGRVLARAMDLVGADAGAIALADKATGEFSFVNVHYASLPPLESEKKEKMLRLVRLKLADGVLGEVYATGKPQTAADLSSHAAFRKDVSDTVGYEVKNLMAVPLSIDGERLGVLELLNKTPAGAFTPLDVDLAMAVANQIALVVEAHRLREAAGSSAASSTDEAARLAEENRALAAKLKDAEAAAEAARAEAEALKARAGSAEEAAEGRTRAAREAEDALKKDLDAARDKAAALEGELAKARTEAEAVEKRLAESRGEAEAARAKAEAAERAALEARRAAEEAKAAAEAAEKRAREGWAAEQGAKAAQEAAADARRRLEELEERAAGAEEKARHLSEDLETAFRQHEKSQRAIQELTEAVEEGRRAAIRPREHREALVKALSAVSSNQPTDAVLDAILAAVATLLSAEASSLLLVDEETGRLYFAAATGVRKDPLKKVFLKEGEGIAGWVAKNGKLLNIPDVARDPRFSDQADKSAGFQTRSILAAPLFSDGRLIGVAEAVNKKDGEPFSDEDVEALISMSLYAAMVIRKAQIYWDMNELFLSTVRALSDAIEGRGAGGKGRAERVRRLALALAGELGDPADGLRDLEIAALLHDMGKIIVPEAALQKAEGLTEEETRLLLRAPIVAAELLSTAKPLKNVVPMVRHVNERWDGKGHPDKLKGEAIPRGARVIAVASVYEAMTADRPYRRRLPDDVAVKEIQTLKGAQLDPEAVEALVRLYRKGRLKDLFKPAEK